MYQPWIFGTMLATGGGLVALTVTLQRPPAPAHAVAEDPGAAVHVVPPPTPSTVTEPATTLALEIPPIVIEGRVRIPTRAVASRAEPAVAPAERPCSEWRALGPTHVVAGKPSGDLSVRELCQ